MEHVVAYLWCCTRHVAMPSRRLAEMWILPNSGTLECNGMVVTYQWHSVINNQAPFTNYRYCHGSCRYLVVHPQMHNSCPYLTTSLRMISVGRWIMVADGGGTALGRFGGCSVLCQEEPWPRVNRTHVVDRMCCSWCPVAHPVAFKHHCHSSDGLESKPSD